MDLSDLAPLAGSLAKAGLPALGTLLGAVLPPPFDLIPGPLFKGIAAVLGVDPAAPDAPAQVQAQVDADPSAAAQKLQTIEDGHKAMADAANDELRIRTADVQGARDTTVSLAQAGSQVVWGAPIVSVIVTAGFIGILTILLFVKLNPDANGVVVSVVSVLVGTLATAFGQVVNYWLGSSAGSRAKDEHLAQLARAPTVQAQPGSHVSASQIKGGR